jgi:hypothetical protein
MALFGGQTGQHHLASLTNDGAIAAVYPTEDQLWLYGPMITDPGDQGVAGNIPEPPVPQSPQQSLATDVWIDRTLNGPTPNGAYGEHWVNLAVGGPTGYGNWNEQPFFSGHSQIIQSNPAGEQGWGVGPARRWAHYPFAEGQNPTRNFGKHLRMGQDPTEGAPETAYAQRTAQAWELQWEPYKQRVPVSPVVPVATTVPFTQTVPTYAGGQVPLPGIDVPLTDTGSGYY